MTYLFEIPYFDLIQIGVRYSTLFGKYDINYQTSLNYGYYGFNMFQQNTEGMDKHPGLGNCQLGCQIPDITQAKVTACTGMCRNHFLEDLESYAAI